MSAAGLHLALNAPLPPQAASRLRASCVGARARAESKSALPLQSSPRCRHRRRLVTLSASSRERVEEWESMAPPNAPPSRLGPPTRPAFIPRERGLSKNQTTAAVALALGALVLLYTTRNGITPVRDFLIGLEEGPFITKYDDGDVLIQGPMGDVYYSLDSDGNQLAIQGNGDLYIERTGSDGRLAGAYYAGNIQDVPMSDPRELAARVDRILDDGQE